MTYHSPRRPRWYAGKRLTAEDFTREQRYHRRRLNAIAQHFVGKGIVRGLRIDATDDNTVKIAAGLAVDSDGELLFWPETTQREVPLNGGPFAVRIRRRDPGPQSIEATGDVAGTPEGSTVEVGRYEREDPFEEIAEVDVIKEASPDDLSPLPMAVSKDVPGDARLLVPLHRRDSQVRGGACLSERLAMPM